MTAISLKSDLPLTLLLRDVVQHVAVPSEKKWLNNCTKHEHSS